MAAFGVKELNIFCTWGLNGGEWSVSLRRRFNHRKMDALQRWCGCFGEEENLVYLLRLEFRFLGGPVRRPVSISTELYWLNTKSEVGGGKDG